jgi:2-polyprenyl-6-methoxyphenol hydroxylase-like FAD-dependent oxidoreductase
LAGLGHEVTLFERFTDPQPVGAGILLLRPTGQSVLARRGVLDRVAGSAVIDRVYAESHRGRVVMDFGYADVEPGLHALGVHRGLLFHALYDEIEDAAVELRLGIEVAGVDPGPGGRHVVDRVGRAHGPFDLVVAADGARSQVRRANGTVRQDREYPWGAIWAIVDDSRHRYTNVLYQHYGGTRVTLGLLPNGVGLGDRSQVSLYWSVENARVEELRGRGLVWFKRTIHELTSEADEVLDRITDIDQLVHASYRDVVMRPFHSGDGLVFVGDAAHAMSPQLGQGANLALLDAVALAGAIESSDRIDRALEAYDAATRRHVGVYTWMSRLMTPLFQSTFDVLGPPRDLLLEPVSRPAPIRRFMDELLAGRVRLGASPPPTGGHGRTSGRSRTG